MVRSLLFAARRRELTSLEKLLHVRPYLLGPPELPENLTQIHATRVDGIVGAGVRDVAVGVEVLGEPRRPRGADPDARRRREKAGGVERYRGRTGGRLLLDLRDRGNLCQLLVRCPRRVFLPETPVGVAGGERLAIFQIRFYLPVGLGDKGPPFALALGDEDEGRALDTAHREEGAPVAFCGAGDPAGQGRAPDQVYVLARLTRRREVPRNLDELVEGTRHLALGERAETCPVEVRGDYDPVGLFGEGANGLGHALLRDRFLDLRVYKIGGLDLLPVRVLLWVLGVQNVPLETDRDTLLTPPLEGVVRDRAMLALLYRPFSEELGYLFGRICLFGDY